MNTVKNSSSQDRLGQLSPYDTNTLDLAKELHDCVLAEDFIKILQYIIWRAITKYYINLNE